MPDQPIAVLIVDDHQMFAQSIAAALASVGGISVVGQATSIAGAREWLSVNHADVMLLDQRLPDGRGSAAVGQLRADYAGMRALLLSAGVDDAVLAEALRAGCAGYVHKSESVDYLATAIRAAHAGATSIAPGVLERLVNSGDPAAPSHRLTARELSILALLAEGLTSTEICARAFISPNTLRNHTQNILTKLGVHSKLEAVTFGIREGLVTAPGGHDH